ncbi:MAG: dihydrodipicolinate synthase family protein [Pseudomonadota bacterium]
MALGLPVGPTDLEGIVAILPTPSLPGADRWDCEASVDLEATSAMTEMIAGAGIDLFMTCGSFGEGASLLAQEHEALTRCVAETLAGHGLLFAGATTMNTRETIHLARRLVAAGADGLFLGRPMWMSLDGPGIVRFYRDVAEALPGIPVIVYDNEFAFKAKIGTETYKALAAIPQVIATKHIGGPTLAADLEATAGSMAVLPLDNQWPALAREHPSARAAWTGNAADGPEPLVALAAAVAAKDFARADTIAGEMAHAQAPMFPGGKLENFVDYNIPIAHARLEGSGKVRTGPPRPPYTTAPDGHLEGGRETGRRWARLCERYRDLPQRTAT